MSYKSSQWEIDKFPMKSKIPSFRFLSAFGPNSSLDAVQELVRDNQFIEEINLDTNSIRLLQNHEDIEKGGDFLYVIGSDCADYLFVLSTDIEWAVLYSNIDPSKLMPGFDFVRAAQDFEESLSRRTSVDKVYYETEILWAWAGAAGFDVKTNMHDAV